MELSRTQKLDIAKDIMQSIEWLKNDIKSFDAWAKNECWRFDAEQYETDMEYKEEKDSEYDKYVSRCLFRNLISEKIAEETVKIMAKNI